MLDVIGDALFEVERRLLKYFARLWIQNLSLKKHEILAVGKSGYKKSIYEAGLTQAAIAEIEAAMRESREVVLAAIDQDGLYLPNFPLFPEAPQVSATEFMPRTKFEIFLVAIDGYLGIKKCYGQRREAFLTELLCLDRLGEAKCNVPAVLDVDFDKFVITMSYIKGEVLREALAKSGARIRDRQLIEDGHALKPGAIQRQIRTEEASRHIGELVDSEYLKAIRHQVECIHLSNIAIVDFKYGNIIMENQLCAPFFIDFEMAEIGFSWFGLRGIRKHQQLDLDRLQYFFRGLNSNVVS